MYRVVWVYRVVFRGGGCIERGVYKGMWVDIWGCTEGCGCIYGVYRGMRVYIWGVQRDVGLYMGGVQRDVGV